MDLTAVGYARVSTDRQADRGLSLGEQAEEIRAWCDKEGRELDLFEDHKSGRYADRRKVATAVEKACELKVPFVACTMDRFSRNMLDTCKFADQLEKGGSVLILLKEDADFTTADGKFQLHIWAALAERFSNKLSERMKESVAYRKKHGLAFGPAPFGYYTVPIGNGNPGKKLVEIIDEQAVIERMVELRGAGLPYAAIAARLTAEGYHSRNGNGFHAATIYKILKRQSK